MRQIKKRAVLGLVLALSALASFGATGAVAATGNATDKAFVSEMPMHHEMAIEMATMAIMQGEHAEIKSTARAIVKAQSEEITKLKRIARTLGVTPVAAGDHMAMMEGLDTLGLTMKQSGMDMTMGDLDGAKPFDREFIDMMVPHHQGAIRMARVELKRGVNGQLRTIARAIISGQAKEIREMNAWRTKWYGAPSPAGGVPQG
jgi:uncharacterized protein (DUF305 family)